MNNRLASIFLVFLAVIPESAQTVAPGYIITTIAGKIPAIPVDGEPALHSYVDRSWGLAWDRAGNIYLAEWNRIFKITPDGTLRVVAGNGSRGDALDGAPALSSPLSPIALAADQDGTLYMLNQCRIIKVSTDSVLHVVAGGPSNCIDSVVRGGSMAKDKVGNFYVAHDSSLLKVAPDGAVSRLVGTVTQNGTPYMGFNDDGLPGPQTTVWFLEGVAVSPSGEVYFADRNNHRIRKVMPDGTVQTVAGNPDSGNRYPASGPAKSFYLGNPSRIAFDDVGNLFILDDQSIVRVTPDGFATRVAGPANPQALGPNYTGKVDLPPIVADLGEVWNIAVDGAGRKVCMFDGRDMVIRLLDVAKGTVTVIAGDFSSGDGGPATKALFNFQRSYSGAAVDSQGNLYVSDTGNRRIRKITPDGIVSTVAGNGDIGSAQEGVPGTLAPISYPQGLALDSRGNLYIADYLNNRVLVLSVSGALRTFAGTGGRGISGDGGPALKAEIGGPIALVFDSQGNLYVSQAGFVGFTAHTLIRKIDGAGVISTIAGTTDGHSGDGGPATAAQLACVGGMAFDRAGNLYAAESCAHWIRTIKPDGTISTYAGNGAGTDTGENIPAVAAGLSWPSGIAIDSTNNLFIAAQNLRKVSPDGIISTVAQMYSPNGITIDKNNNLYVMYYNSILKISPVTPKKLAVVSGDGQFATTSNPVRAALVVRASGVNDLAVVGTRVTFAVVAGTATLSPTSVVTDAKGIAQTTATLGDAAGSVIITATIAGLSPVQFNLTAFASGTPLIASGGITGSGGSVPPVGPISPNALVSIYGQDFAPPETRRTVGADDLVDGRLPTKLAGVCVKVGGLLAPIIGVYPGQINIQVPNVPLGTTVEVQVLKNCGESVEVPGNMQSVSTQMATPEFLFWTLNANGKSPVVALNAATGAYVGPLDLTLVPAKPGDVVTVYGISFGTTDPSFAPGEAPDRIAPTVLAPSVKLGTLSLAATDIFYAGVSPGTVGLYQLNIHLPANLSDGDYPLTLSLRTFFTPTGGFIAVRR